MSKKLLMVLAGTLCVILPLDKSASQAVPLTDNADDQFTAAFVSQHPALAKADCENAQLVNLRAASPIVHFAQSKAFALRHISVEQLAGNWQGTYWHTLGGKKAANTFDMNLSFIHGKCVGTIEEPNTFGNLLSDKLYATVDQCCLERENGRYIFSMRKTYDGTAGVSHNVEYEGVLSASEMTIEGRWRIGQSQGTFRMRRK